MAERRRAAADADRRHDALRKRHAEMHQAVVRAQKAEQAARDDGRRLGERLHRRRENEERKAAIEAEIREYAARVERGAAEATRVAKENVGLVATKTTNDVWSSS